MRELWTLEPLCWLIAATQWLDQTGRRHSVYCGFGRYLYQGL